MGAMSKRPVVGLNTLAACETCGQFVDVPLEAKKLAVAQFDHRLDEHPGYPALFRPLVQLVDPQGLWDVILRTVRPTPPGRKLR